jgi:hypothetical protein
MSVDRLSRPVALFSFAFYICTLASGFGQEPLQVTFRTVEGSMIVVPVTINGSGPFDFLLDTGTTNTLVDRKLAEELNLPPAGKMMLETASRAAVTPLAHTDSLSMAGATVLGLNILVVNHYSDLLANVRGSVGEDFLRNFDLLIDNRRHLIQFEPGPGQLVESLTGEHLLLSLNGFNEPEPTENQLVVVGHFYGNKDMKLQLDSGTPSIVLFSELDRLAFMSRKTPPRPVSGILGGGFAALPQPAMYLQLGKKRFPDLTIVAATGNIPAMDIDGLLPLSLFKSIFISHSGKFVILDPRANPAPAQSKSPSLPATVISGVQSGRNSSSSTQ